jgi:hypothetical protein
MTIKSLAWTVLLLSGANFTGRGLLDGAQAGNSGQATLACNRKALTHDAWQRHDDLTRTLFSAVAERRELDDGYAFRLDSSKVSVAGLGEWIANEHRCCPFLRFRMDVNETGGVWLTLSGGHGVKAFIEAALRSLI